MKKITCVILCAVAVFAFCSCAAKQEASSDAADEITSECEASEEEKISYEISYKNVKKIKSADGVDILQAAAGIKNTGNTDITLGLTAYDIVDGSGSIFTTGSSPVRPDVLAPGETGYIFENIMTDRDTDGEYKIVPQVNVQENSGEPVRFQVSGEELAEDENYGLVMKGKVKNIRDAEVPSIFVAAFLFDADGQCIAMLSDFTDALAAGEEAEFECKASVIEEGMDKACAADYKIFAYAEQNA